MLNLFYSAFRWLTIHWADLAEVASFFLITADLYGEVRLRRLHQQLHRLCRAPQPAHQWVRSAYRGPLRGTLAVIGALALMVDGMPPFAAKEITYPWKDPMTIPYWILLLFSPMVFSWFFVGTVSQKDERGTRAAGYLVIFLIMAGYVQAALAMRDSRLAIVAITSMLLGGWRLPAFVGADSLGIVYRLMQRYQISDWMLFAGTLLYLASKIPDFAK